MYETIERRATTLVLVAGIAIPLIATTSAFTLSDDTKAAGVLLLVALGLVAVAVVLAVAAVLPDQRTDQMTMKAQLVFWAHAAFAAGVLVVAANVAYLVYRFLTADSLEPQL